MAVESGALPPERRRASAPACSRRQPFLPPLLITSILLTAHLSFGILEGWERTALAIVTAIGAELTGGPGPTGVAASRKLAHQRYQRRHSHSLAVLLAAFPDRPHFDHLERPYVLRFRGRHLWNPTNFGVSAVVPLAPATVAVLSVQKRRRADGGDLGARHGHRVARRPLSHFGDARIVLPAVLILPSLVDGDAMGRERRADHRADVSALYLLHGHRPEDDGEVGEGQRGDFLVAVLNRPASERSRVCAVLRTVRRRTNRAARRTMA